MSGLSDPEEFAENHAHRMGTAPIHARSLRMKDGAEERDAGRTHEQLLDRMEGDSEEPA